MNDTNYKLANIARQELKRQEMRRQILQNDAQTALDMILDAPSPATLVQSFPDQDLYYLMHKIGVHDFTPVLALAASSQWEYILDIEVWDDDRLDTPMMTQVFSQLFKADPQRLLRWVITEKPDFFEYYLSHNLTVVVREHDEPPPSDYDDYTTLDDKFYFRFPQSMTLANGTEDASEDPSDDELSDSTLNDEAPELIETMLKTLAEMDLSVFHGLMLETTAVLPTETEEEQFRLKTIRLAEKGFLPPHEAVGIYQPLSRLKKRPVPHQTGDALDADIPLPPMFFTQFIAGDSLFARAMTMARDSGIITDFQSEFAALLNKIIAADRIKLRHRESIEKVMGKAMAYLSLGLEVLIDADAPGLEQAARTIGEYFLEDIFRTGSREGITLRTRAKAWYEQSYLKQSGLPLSFLGESYLGVIGGLMIQRPMFFTDYADKDLYRHFSSRKDIQSTDRILGEVMCLDEFLAALNVDLTTFTKGVLTYKSMILTCWTRQRMDIDLPGRPSLAPIPLDLFQPFFADLFSRSSHGDGTKIDNIKIDDTRIDNTRIDNTRIDDTRAQDLALWAAQVLGISETGLHPRLQTVLYSLIREVEDEYGNVAASTLDPRFIPHFLLDSRKS